MQDITLTRQVPPVDAYLHLRDSVGWGNGQREVTECALRHSLFGVTLWHGKTVIGCGRIVGDAGLCYYIQDVIVLPAYQRQGLGRRIMKTLMEYCDEQVGRGAFVGLMAAHGVEPLYTQFGFIARPTATLGAGMIRFGPLGSASALHETATQ